MRLICEGRASQIFDLGDGRVLRRVKRGGDAEREARLMRLAGAGDEVGASARAIGGSASGVRSGESAGAAESA